MDSLGMGTVVGPTVYSLDDEIDLDEIFGDFREPEQEKGKLCLDPVPFVEEDLCKPAARSGFDSMKMGVRRKGSCGSDGGCNPHQGCDTCKNASVCFPVIKNLESTLQRELSPLERWQALSDILDWVSEQPEKQDSDSEAPAAVESTFETAADLPELLPCSPDFSSGSVSSPSLAGTDEEPSTPSQPTAAEAPQPGSACSSLAASPALPSAVKFGPRAVGQKALLARLAHTQRECVREIHGSLALLPAPSATPPASHSLQRPAAPRSAPLLTTPSCCGSRGASRAASPIGLPLPPEALVTGADSVPLGSARHLQLQRAAASASAASAVKLEAASIKVEPMCLNVQQPAIARVQAASVYVDSPASPSPAGYASPMLSPPDSPCDGNFSGISSAGSLVDEAFLGALPPNGLASLAPWSPVDSPVPAPASPAPPAGRKCPNREKKIARPHNCFILFMKEARPKIKEKWPHLTNAQISKLLGDLWAALPAEKKRKYEDMADRLREEFERQNPDLAKDPLLASRRPRFSPVPPSAF